MLSPQDAGISRVNSQCLKPGSFAQAKHQVHILDGLPGSSFDQVIKAANNNEPPRPVVDGRMNKTEVAPPGVLGMWGELYYLDKGFIPVEVQIELS